MASYLLTELVNFPVCSPACKATRIIKCWFCFAECLKACCQFTGTLQLLMDAEIRELETAPG